MYSEKMESASEGRLGLQQTSNFSWKGRTFLQVYACLNKNNVSYDEDANPQLFLKTLPMKLYRREITSSHKPSFSNNRISQSIRLNIDTPSGTIPSSQQCTDTMTIDMIYNESKTAHPCNECDVSFREESQSSSKYLSSLSQQDNARRRVRSSGMVRPRYNNSGKPDSYDSAHQYMYSRNRTYQQNQYTNIRVPSTVDTSNKYSSNTVSYCEDPSHNFFEVYYKPNNAKYSSQGAVSSSSQLLRRKYDTITDVGNKMRTAFGNQTANALAYGTSYNGYTIKDKMGYPNTCTPIIKTTGSISTYC